MWVPIGKKKCDLEENGQVETACELINMKLYT